MQRNYYSRLMEAIGPKPDYKPKTPCRNVCALPCVDVIDTTTTKFRTEECMPHRCSRVVDEYEVGQIPHEMALDPDGSETYIEMGDYHGGPKCMRCGELFCIHCEPGVRTDVCSNQDLGLF